MSSNIEPLTNQFDKQFFWDKESASDSDSDLGIRPPKNPTVKRKSLNEMEILNTQIKGNLSELIQKCNQFIGQIKGEKTDCISRKETFISKVQKYVDAEANQLIFPAENRKGLRLLEKLKRIAKHFSGEKVKSIYTLGRTFIPWSVVRNNRPRCIDANPYAWLEN